MSFMMKKKKYKFQVEICVEELTAVPFVSAVLFAKVRLLDGGSFSETSSREEVQNHLVRWGAKFMFVCKMSANASTGILDPCIVRVSVRKELKGGRSFQKLGFCDLNLAEFAGAGQTVRRCLLEGYDTRHRQDNSMLRVSIGMNMLSGDVLFKVPSPSLKQKQLAAEEPTERKDFSSGSIASGSSGFGSLPKKRPALFGSELITGNETHVEQPIEVGVVLEPAVNDENHEPGHSRNSSNTSQLSKASGYSSLNSHSHSRQSSSGDSGHIRSPSWPVWAPRLPPLPSSTAPPSPINPSSLRINMPKTKVVPPLTPMLFKSVTTPSFPPRHMEEDQKAIITSLRFPSPWSTSSKSLSSPGMLHSPSQNRRTAPSMTADSPLRNSSSGSAPIETGSLDRAKSALERRKKTEEASTGSARVEVTRVNPDSLIDELLRSTNLTQSDESAEAGLQLFISKDGTSVAR